MQQLYDLAKQVNVDASGSVTILYKGKTTKDGTDKKPPLTPQQVFDGMKLNGESIRIVDDTVIFGPGGLDAA